MSSASWLPSEESSSESGSDEESADIYGSSEHLLPPDNSAGASAPEPPMLQFRIPPMAAQLRRWRSKEQLANSGAAEVQAPPPATAPPRKGKLGTFLKKFAFQDRITESKSAQLFSIAPDIPRNFSANTDIKAERYLKKINSKKLQPSITAQRLLWQFFDARRENKWEVVDCIAWKLLCASKSFHELPGRKLYNTALLFGGLLDYELLKIAHIEIFLSIIYEELSAPVGSKGNDFGLVALYFIRSRLKDIPEYCQMISQLEHFKDFPPYLKHCVEAGLAQQPLDEFQFGIPTTPVGVRLSAPAPEVQEFFCWILNSLTPESLSVQCDALRESVRRDDFMWMALYLVVQRVSKEAGPYTLYSELLDGLNIPEFTTIVIQETLRNVQMLLRENMGEKRYLGHLKNLGQWLGMITLEKCRPLRIMDINLRTVIAEANNRGEEELMYVIPFVIKLLESCVASKIFRVPHPWTISALSDLRELYDQPSCTWKLQLEIEALCQKFNIRITKLKPSGFLKQKKCKRCAARV